MRFCMRHVLWSMLYNLSILPPLTDELCLTHAAPVEYCAVTKIRKSSNFSHCNSLPQPHVSNEACLNHPQDA